MDNPCGHSSHEYNPYAERHECCDSRYCLCTCHGAKEREERYNRAYKEWLVEYVTYGGLMNREANEAKP